VTPRSKGLRGIYCGEEVAEVHGRSQKGGRTPDGPWLEGV
jgi:hypothetical protein